MVGGAADGAALPEGDAGVGVAGGGVVPGGTITLLLGLTSVGFLKLPLVSSPMSSLCEWLSETQQV